MYQRNLCNIGRLTFAMLMLTFTGCLSTSNTTSPDDMIQGTWKSADSVAVYEISMADGKMTVAGHSSFSGKIMNISDVTWDGETLTFTSHMPSTGHTVHHENQLVDAETMRSAGSGSSTHSTTWKKEK